MTYVKFLLALLTFVNRALDAIEDKMDERDREALRAARNAYLVSETTQETANAAAQVDESFRKK